METSSGGNGRVDRMSGGNGKVERMCGGNVKVERMCGGVVKVERMSHSCVPALICETDGHIPSRLPYPLPSLS